MKYFFILLSLSSITASCNSRPEPKVVYEEEEQAGQQNKISDGDMARLRGWQRGNTAGNAFWSLSALQNGN